ncbi:DNA polymerase III subunit gamma/tau [Puia dinghuensis]|uniref:DNA polymerase III subunit gamma/tau n=1 Tax=Puia dinghuensis TaxID=1792502 RepID=A0A8J2XTT3_9BACT|nr:DNA polymerase III subunit gamma/tau [Puia dinghuensis]GGB05949.1 DNA polymerase III subunit gamma/tau [Puia dinghuensis]
MDKFIVSARKYRPQDFSTVVGQAHITTTLKNAIKNRQLAHAFLFCGPRGVGKTTCARILAKTINCENVTPEGEACNTCQSCVTFNEGTSLNIHELDAASNNSVDDIRTLVEQVRFAPQAGKYKVYIIDEVHMLSTSAFNAFLKTLEEPPPYAIFILATTEKHKILPTILSRCQIFDFKRITAADTVEHLQDICKKENITAEKPALQMIAQKSEGCMRDALSILDKIVSFTNGELTYQNTLEHLNILDADYYFRILDAMQQQNVSDALLTYDSINRKGFEGDLVLNGLAEFVRNLLVCKDEKVAVLLEVVESFRDRYITAGQSADTSYLVSTLNVLNEAEINYKSARNKRLHVELALIKLCYLAQALQVTAGDANGKKKQPEAVKPVSFRNIPAMELVKATVAAPTAQRAAERGPAGAQQAAERVAEPAAAGGAKLIVEEGAPEPVKKATAPPAQPASSGQPTQPTIPATASLGSLSRIRQQFSTRQQNDDASNSRPLEPEALHKAWQQYADYLRENRNPAVQSMELATLRITDAHTFEVVTNNNLEQKFVEQEKRTLSDHLQKAFANKAISFTVIIEEKEAVDEEPADRPLNKREQFIQIVEQYPLVKELKDRLRLELDY